LAFFGLSIGINGQADVGRITNLAKSYVIPANIQAHITLGYQNSISVLKWFSLINDFGDSSREIDATDIAARLDTITRLNPYAEPAYYMAAMILPWHMHSTQLSEPFLVRAMRVMPNKWQWPYYRGFNAYWFDHDMESAARLMSQAAQLPDAPPMVASLAARMHAESNNLDTALTFLYHLLNNKQDKALVEQLENQIKQIQTEKVLRGLDHVLAHFPDWRKSGKDLRALGIRVPGTLPDGGHVIINAKGIPVSSANRKRFKVFVPPHRQRQQK